MIIPPHPFTLFFLFTTRPQRWCFHFLSLPAPGRQQWRRDTVGGRPGIQSCWLCLHGSNQRLSEFWMILLIGVVILVFLCESLRTFRYNSGYEVINEIWNFDLFVAVYSRHDMKYAFDNFVPFVYQFEISTITSSGVIQFQCFICFPNYRGIKFLFFSFWHSGKDSNSKSFDKV